MHAKNTVGIVGVGLLGSAMAERLLAANFQVIGFDVDDQRRQGLQALGGQAVDSAAAVFTACRRVLLSLPTSDIARGVVREVQPLLLAGDILIDTTTGDPETMADMGALLAKDSVQYIDATVGGSSKQARAGEVIVIAGGDAAVVDGCHDVLNSFARDVFHVGPCGSGARMKLVLNLVLGLNRAVLAEGLTFARAVGLDPTAALEILRAGPTYSRVMDTKGEKMLNEDFSLEARLSQHLKDVRLILAAAERLQTTTPLSAVHQKLLADAVAAGYGDCDNSAVIKSFS